MPEHVQSLNRAIALLNCLEKSGHPLTLQDIATRAELPKSTVYRLLATLEEAGLVERNAEDGTYLLGLRLLELGFSAGASRDVIRIAKPYMQCISYEIDESVCLSQINRGEALIPDFNESVSAFHVVSKVGARLPVHCTVQGKIMLAHMNGVRVRQILKEHGMQVYTPNTIRSLTNSCRSWSEYAHAVTQ